MSIRLLDAATAAIAPAIERVARFVLVISLATEGNNRFFACFMATMVSRPITPAKQGHPLLVGAKQILLGAKAILVGAKAANLCNSLLHNYRAAITKFSHRLWENRQQDCRALL